MPPTVAVVFPGQGSQSVGMLSELAMLYPMVADTFGEANDYLGYDLWHIIKEGPAAILDSTTYTQPALLTAAYAVWRLLQNQYPFKPAYLAGHSLGEYTALVCAGVLTFKDALHLVAARAEYMQSAAPMGVGGLAAIVGLEDQQVVTLCLEAAMGEVVAPANYNCPGQVVVAGHLKAVERVIDLAKQAGAKIAKLLPVSVPSHCGLMQPAAWRLAELLANIPFHKPSFSVIHNVDVRVHTEVAKIRHALTQQLFKPVRWVETIQYLEQQEVALIVECGPGKVLTGLNRRIVTQVNTMVVNDQATLTAFSANTALKENELYAAHR